MVCGALLALMIPRLKCPPGMNLSPVFRFCVSFCVSPDLMYSAPSPGLPWRFAAFGVGIVLGIVMLRWRSMPWWLASAIVVVACLGTALFTVSRSTGIPGIQRYTPPPAVVAAVVIGPSLVPVRLRPDARRGRRRVRRS
jgi:peptidoglycan/LPS O-acetylase OafA/YrhL